MSLHLCSGVNVKTLYISAEESEEQVALRAQRLKIDQDHLFLSGENEIEGRDEGDLHEAAPFVWANHGCGYFSGHQDNGRFPTSYD